MFMQYFRTFPIQWSHELEKSIERCKHYSSAKHTYSELDYNLNHNKFRVKLRIHHQPDNTPTYMSNFSIQKWNPKNNMNFPLSITWCGSFDHFQSNHFPSSSLTLSPTKILLPCSAYHEFQQDPTYRMRQNQNGKLGGPGGKKSLGWMIPCRKICRK